MGFPFESLSSQEVAGLVSRLVDDKAGDVDPIQGRRRVSTKRSQRHFPGGLDITAEKIEPLPKGRLGGLAIGTVLFGRQAKAEIVLTITDHIEPEESRRITTRQGHILNAVHVQQGDSRDADAELRQPTDADVSYCNDAVAVLMTDTISHAHRQAY